MTAFHKSEIWVFHKNIMKFLCLSAWWPYYPLARKIWNPTMMLQKYLNEREMYHKLNFLLSAKHSILHPNSLTHCSLDDFMLVTSPLFVFCYPWRWFSRSFKHQFHVRIRHIEEFVHIEIFHKYYAYHSCQPRETPPSFYGALEQG